jgi:hypothetical protein
MVWPVSFEVSVIVSEALAIRLNVLKELFLLHGSYPPQTPQ